MYNLTDIVVMSNMHTKSSHRSDNPELRINVTLRMLPSVKRRAHQLAIAQGISFSDLVEKALERLLEAV